MGYDGNMTIVIDRLVRSRRKTIALIVEHDGRLVVRAPWHLSNRQIERFVLEKEAWIQSRQEAVRLERPKTYAAGEHFLFLGEPYPLMIVEDAKIPLRFDRGFFLKSSEVPRAKQLFETWYRVRAHEVIQARVSELASKPGFIYHQVKITSARARWGSCTSRGNLCFAWRLVMAPLPVIDYVVIHELVHLRQKDHSRSFWELVGELMPDYNTPRRWLRANGSRLSL